MTTNRSRYPHCGKLRQKPTTVTYSVTTVCNPAPRTDQSNFPRMRLWCSLCHSLVWLLPALSGSTVLLLQQLPISYLGPLAPAHILPGHPSTSLIPQSCQEEPSSSSLPAELLQELPGTQCCAAGDTAPQNHRHLDDYCSFDLSEVVCFIASLLAEKQGKRKLAPF